MVDRLNNQQAPPQVQGPQPNPNQAMHDRVEAALSKAYSAKMNTVIDESDVSNIYPGQGQVNEVTFKGEPVFQSLRIKKDDGEGIIVVNCTRHNALLVMARDLTIKELLHFD